MTTMIENLRANGIDNPGIANALTSKLSAAQMAISGGQIQTTGYGYSPCWDDALDVRKCSTRAGRPT